MNLLLFRQSDGRAFIAIERPKLSQAVEKAGQSWWQRTAAKVKSFYQQLQERLDHSERVCANLRHADRLKVYHSSQWEAKSAEEQLHRLLKEGYRKHNRWFWTDGVLACLGIALFWVPGPNVFFFYPAARALAHYFARVGAERALSLESVFTPEPLIDQILERLGDAEGVAEMVSSVEERYNIDSLVYQLSHMREK